VHGKAIALGEQSKNNDVHFVVNYKNRQLSAKADVKLMPRIGGDAGTLTADVQVPLPMTMAQLQERPAALVAQLERRSDIQAKVKLAHLDMARFPFSQLGMTPPLRAGTIEGGLKLNGTMQAPVVAFDLEG